MYEFTLFTVFQGKYVQHRVFTKTVKENIIKYLALHVLQVETISGRSVWCTC